MAFAAFDSEVNQLGAMAVHLSARNLDDALAFPLPPFVDTVLHLLLESGYQYVDDGKLYLCRRGDATRKRFSLPLPADQLLDGCSLPNRDWIFTGGGLGNKVHLMTWGPLTAPHAERSFTAMKWMSLPNGVGVDAIEEVEPEEEEEDDQGDEDPDEGYDPTSIPLGICLLVGKNASDFVAIADMAMQSVVVVNWRTFKVSHQYRLAHADSCVSNRWTGALAAIGCSGAVLVIRDPLDPESSVQEFEFNDNETMNVDSTMCWVSADTLVVIQDNVVSQLLLTPTSLTLERQFRSPLGKDDDDEEGGEEFLRPRSLLIRSLQLESVLERDWEFTAATKRGIEPVWIPRNDDEGEPLVRMTLLQTTEDPDEGVFGIGRMFL